MEKQEISEKLWWSCESIVLAIVNNIGGNSFAIFSIIFESLKYVLKKIYDTNCKVFYITVYI